MSKQTDSELLENVKAGGEEGRHALSVLHSKYNFYVQGEARRFIPGLAADIADFCSEVWIRTIKAIPNFRGDSLGALLGKAYWGGGPPQGIIGHYSVEFLRKKAGQPASIDIEIDHDEDKATFISDNLTELDSVTCHKSVLEEMQWREHRRAIVRDEIMKLPQADIYLIYLTYWQGLNAKEISEMLGISEEMVWKRLSRVREALRDPLAKRLHIPYKRREEK